MPQWDIGLVLRAFAAAPFEPVQTASREALMYRVLVLLALATGALHGDFLPLHRGPEFLRPAPDWSSVLLYADPKFLPKTICGRKPTEPIKLKALPAGEPPVEDAVALCPVRCLRGYRDLTSDPYFVN